MSEYGQSQPEKLTSEPKSGNLQQNRTVSMDENGELVLFESPGTYSSGRPGVASASGSPNHLGISNLLKPLAPPHQASAKDLFMKAFESTRCFHCMDRGYISIPHRTPLGRHQIAYQCTCQQGLERPFGGKQIANIASLILQGYYQPCCQLGGEDGQYCPLEAKPQKCFEFSCPKFRA